MRLSRARHGVPQSDGIALEELDDNGVGGSGFSLERTASPLSAGPVPNPSYEADKEVAGSGFSLERTMSPLAAASTLDQSHSVNYQEEIDIVVAEASPRVEVLAAEEYRPHSAFALAEQIDPEHVELLPDKLGEGRFGTVRAGLLTDDRGRHVRVAIKMLSGLKATEVAVFEQEIRVLQHVGRNCSNVCRLYGTCWLEKQLCIVMKRYETSLDKLIDTAPGRKLPLRQVVQLMSQVSMALSELHEHRVIVHDLKPSNILVDEFGQAIIADFGVSTVCETQSLYTPTNAGSMKGTFNYMSAEAFDPTSFGGVTAKTDIWSFGCSFLELVSGKVPWEGISQPVIMNLVLNKGEHPPVPQHLPPGVQELLQRCFLSPAAKRPSAKEMFKELQSLQSELPSADETQLSAGEKRMAKWVREDLGIQNITDDTRFVEVVCQKLKLPPGPMRDTLLRAEAIILRETKDLESSPSNPFSKGYFLSHNQGRSGPAVMRMKGRMERACPKLRNKLWYDKDNRPTEDEMRLGIKRCEFFLLYLSREVLRRPFVRREIRWAIHYQKKIVLVWEQEGENAVGAFGTFFDECGIEIDGENINDLTGDLFGQNVAIPYFSDEDFGAVSLAQILREGGYETEASLLLAPRSITMPPWAHANLVYCQAQGEGQAMSIKHELEEMCPSLCERVITFQDEMVARCTLVVFVTEGVFAIKAVVDAMRSARSLGNSITLVVETDERHSGAPMDDIHTVPSKLLLDAPTDILQVIQESAVVPFYKDRQYRRVALVKVLQSMTRTPQSLVLADSASTKRTVRSYARLVAAVLLLVTLIALSMTSVFRFEGADPVNVVSTGGPSSADACDFDDPVVAKLEHTTRQCGTSPDGSHKVQSGTECSVTCNVGYRQDGSSFVHQGKRTCQDGSWSGLLPTCQAEACTSTVSPASSHMDCVGTTGGSCRLQCDPGYRTIGDTNLVCGADHVFRGEGSCEDIDECATDNGGCADVEICTNSPGSYDCQTCVSGFSRGNGRNSSTTPCSPRCVEGGKRFPCVFPFAYDGREYNDCTAESLPADLPAGSTWCATGLGPSDYKRCIDCSDVLTCPALQAPPHGSLARHPENARPFAFGTTYEVKCGSDGYAFGGPVHRQCAWNESWDSSATSTCIDRCTDTGATCKFPFRLNGVVYYDCTEDTGPKGTEGSAWCATGDDARSQFAKCVPCAEVDCGAIDDHSVQGHYTQQCNSSSYAEFGTCHAGCNAGFFDKVGTLAGAYATCGKDYAWHWTPRTPVCEACPQGSYAANGSTSCESCRPGMYDDDLNAATPCVICRAGSMTNTGQNDGATTCTQCRPGRFTAHSTITCQDCPKGHITDTLAASGATACTACDPGAYSPSSVEPCAPCPPGHATNKNDKSGSSLCTICNAGSFSPRSTQACELCRPGWWANVSGLLACLRCSPGHVTDTLTRVGATSCDLCSVGRYSAHPTDACKTCHPGHYTDTLAAPGAVSCSPCAAGQFTPNARTPCSVCEPGHYTDTLQESGSSRCTLCDAGQFSSSSTVACTRCDPGLYAASAGAVQCAACSPGSATDTLHSAGATSCDTCAPGRFSASATIACTRCDAGHTTDTLDQPAAQKCTACEPGQYTASAVQACQDCQPGHATDMGAQSGSTRCTACEPGQFSAHPTIACAPCRHGTNAREVGATDCETCERLYGLSCGDHGECRDACAVSGTCAGTSRAPGEGVCVCESEFYTGDRCEHHDPCEGWSCSSHGKCNAVSQETTGEDIASCTCDGGYSGQHCETSVCDFKSCGSHGECRIEVPPASAPPPPGELPIKTHLATATCVCSDGFSGDECQTAPDPCLGFYCRYGTCKAYGNRAQCDCFGGYSGSACDIPPSSGGGSGNPNCDTFCSIGRSCTPSCRDWGCSNCGGSSSSSSSRRRSSGGYTPSCCSAGCGNIPDSCCGSIYAECCGCMGR